MEEWRAVPGWEGFYEVSDQGRVRSVDREFVNARGHRRKYPSCVIEPVLTPSGRPQVTLFNKNYRKSYRVHQLVLFAFVGPCPDGMEACHGNGDRCNNRLSNLRWGTHLENMSDAIAHGTTTSGGGRSWRTHCPRKHLLIVPNLMPSQLRRNRRVCLSCQRGRIPGGGVDQAKADRAYVSLGFDLVA